MTLYAHLLVFGPLIMSVAFLGGLAVVTAYDWMLRRG